MNGDILMKLVTIKH